MTYSIEHIATIVHGQCMGKIAGEPVISHLLIDSRKLLFPANSLFFALSGKRRDGHVFIPDLYQQGVRHFVVAQKQDIVKYPEAVFVVVADVLEALQRLAAWHRGRFTCPVIAITGSNGKTIVKEWLQQLLEEHYQIVRSPRSYNSQIGVPLSVWQMNAGHQLGIFEAGISQVGEMEKLQRIIQPDIGIFTNIGEAHSEGFLHCNQKLKEKMRLFSNVNLLIYCRDHNDIHEEAARLWQSRHRHGNIPLVLFDWGHHAGASLQILSVRKEQDWAHIQLRYRELLFELDFPFIDSASLENIMHCICVLLYLQTDMQVWKEKIMQLRPVPLRLEMKPAIHHCTLINDSYSADLSSLKLALDFLQIQSAGRAKTVILSDLLESGRPERMLYTEIAQLLQQRDLKRFVGIGEKMMIYRSLFFKEGRVDAQFYPDTEAFLQAFGRIAFRDELILLKGARVFEMERIAALLEQKFHQTLLEINLSALTHNLKQYQQRLNPSTRIMAMVKAFAYGSGTYQIARILEFNGIDYLGVAYTDEAVELRRAGIRVPIMIMNPDPAGFASLVQYQLEPVLYSSQTAEAFYQFLKKEGLEYFPVHLELETGMNRLGFSEAELPKIFPLLKEAVFKLQSVFSHLVAGEDPQHDAFTEAQANRFRHLSQLVAAQVSYSFLRHLSNTSGIERHPELQFDMVRLGIGLYGVGSSQNGPVLKEVSALRSLITQIKPIREGETIGYGRAGLLPGQGRIATVPIGYADGYPRLLSDGRGKILVNGHLAPVVGKVCMDMTMIDITSIPGVKEGDPVLLFGPGLPVAELARWANSIPYEILTGISERVKRIYYEE